MFHQLTCSHYYKLLSINDENKRNYYINMCIKHNLSVRKLVGMIKSNVYERLSYADKENIELITENKSFLPKDNLKSSLHIKIYKDIDRLNGKLLKSYILDQLKKSS